MSPFLATALFLVLLPAVLVALSRLAAWQPYRGAVRVASVLWFTGLAALIVLNTTCEGNLFHGYHSCAYVAQRFVQSMSGLGLYGMILGMGIFVLATLVLGVRALVIRAS
jgi:hypothetical protein